MQCSAPRPRPGQAQIQARARLSLQPSTDPEPDPDLAPDPDPELDLRRCAHAAAPAINLVKIEDLALKFGAFNFEFSSLG